MGCGHSGNGLGGQGEAGTAPSDEGRAARKRSRLRSAREVTGSGLPVLPRRAGLLATAQTGPSLRSRQGSPSSLHLLFPGGLRSPAQTQPLPEGALELP